MEYLWKGLLIGLLVAAPLGPVGLLCVHRVLAERRRRAGFVSGLGSATADTIYACVATWFLSYAARLLGGHPVPVQLIGGLLLCGLGVKLMRTKTHDQADPDQRGTLWSHFISTFFLTLMNPLTVFAMAAIFTAWGLNQEADLENSVLRAVVERIPLIGGIFMGSLLWFGSLSLLVGMMRLHMTAERLRWVNIISGLVMIVFGLAVLVKVALQVGMKAS
ncbi:MAG: LysE family transporter [Kiritimatiellaeota bacterium]|nr:LysE family transporter [Kiritimatiellota bacterium]